MQSWWKSQIQHHPAVDNIYTKSSNCDPIFTVDYYLYSYNMLPACLFDCCRPSHLMGLSGMSRSVSESVRGGRLAKVGDVEWQRDVSTPVFTYMTNIINITSMKSFLQLKINNMTILVSAGSFLLTFFWMEGPPTD